MLKFGVVLCSQYPQGEDPKGRMDEHIEQVRLIRDLGFDSVWASQHYLSHPIQYLHPVPVLARIAAEAGDMAIGTDILLIGLLHPVDVAEELATLDIICGGRLIVGVGHGYREEEFHSFGVPRGERLSRYLEAVEVVKRLWTEKDVHFQGKHFRLNGVTISIRPLQKPHPPIWMAAHTDNAVKRLARSGIPWLCHAHATLDHVARQVELYRRTAQEAGAPLPDTFAINREIHVAPDVETAYRDCAPYLGFKYESYHDWGQDQVLPRSESFDRPMEELHRDRFIMGDPERCQREVQRLIDVLGVNYVLFRVQWPGMPQESIMRSIELLGTEVLPALREGNPA